MTNLISFGDHVWTVAYPLKLMGMKFGTRSTIVALPSGGLVIISPIDFDDELVAAIEELGPVDTIIAPNLLHYRYFNDACRRWPDARALVAPGLDEKIEPVERAVELSEEGSIEEVLSWRVIDGAPKVNEHVFIDSRDDVLILTDIAFHFVDHPQWWLRFMMRLNGVYGRFGPSRLLRSLIKDREAFAQSLAELLEHSWDAVVVAHGKPLAEGGRRAFIDGFSDYLPDEIERD